MHTLVSVGAHSPLQSPRADTEFRLFEGRNVDAMGVFPSEFEGGFLHSHPHWLRPGNLEET